MTLRRRTVPLAIVLAMTGASRAGHASPTAKLVYVRSAGAEVCADEATLKQR